MSNTALGRTEVDILTNQSGGAVAQGDVVIIDIANAEAFTTTTTGAYISGQIGVVIEPNGIANNAPGLVAFTGRVPVINLSGTGSIGDFVKTHTVAKQGVRHAAPQIAGDFAQVLGTSATPKARLFGTVQLGGGSGVTRSGATTDGHLAVWSGASADSIKDGGTVALDYICIIDQKTANTSGGTFTSGAWRTRNLTTEQADTGNNASLASNQITLEAGTYRCRITCPAHKTGRHQAKLYNITDAANVLIGSSQYDGGAGAYSSSRSEIVGRFTLAAQKVLEVQHRCEATSTTFGFGVEANFGENEVYTIAEFWKEK